MVGTSGPDRIIGTDREDVIVARGGDDVVFAKDGNDFTCAGAGDDRMDGGDGADALSGGNGHDNLTGGLGPDHVAGDVGSDRLTAVDDDTLVGGSDNDVLDGGADLFGGPGDDVLVGADGRPSTLYGGGGDDYLHGGLGPSDVASFRFASGPIKATLLTETTPGPRDSATGEGNDELVDIEGLIGSAFDDELTGNDAGNELFGLAGNDVIAALDNVPSPEGATDVVDGGPGDDVLDGGSGNDVLTFTSAPVGVTASLIDGTATGHGTDAISSFVDVNGSFFDDVITGNDEANTIMALYGRDTIFGLGGDDFLSSGELGDAGEGTDTCDRFTGGNCEQFLVLDPGPEALISSPIQGATMAASALDRLAGRVEPGIGVIDQEHVFVHLSRLTQDGCSALRSSLGRFLPRPCSSSLWNRVPITGEDIEFGRGRWRLVLPRPLSPGHYEARVTLVRRPFNTNFCLGFFGPICVEFEIE